MVIIGGSAGLGRHLADDAARRGHGVFLVASDDRDLAATVADLRLRYGYRTGFAACHLECGPGETDAIVSAVKAFGDVDALLYPIGVASQDDTGFLDAGAAEHLVRVNLLIQIWLTTSLWPALAAQQRAYVVGFGSIAAIRGRRQNIVYAAAKRALLSYFESLRHLAVGTGIRVHFYQLGYVDTQQTFGKTLLFPKADPRSVARFVLDRLERDHGPMFYPRYWGVLAWIIRHLPWTVYRRLDF